MPRKAKSSSSASSSSASSQTTTDHEQIRQWVEERGGKPACVKGTSRDEGCLLRIDFPGGAEESLEDMSWDDFFEVFDKRKLAFLYQEEKKGGEQSYFNKLVDRDQQDSKPRGKSRGGSSRSTRHGRSSD